MICRSYNFIAGHSRFAKWHSGVRGELKGAQGAEQGLSRHSARFVMNFFACCARTRIIIKNNKSSTHKGVAGETGGAGRV